MEMEKRASAGLQSVGNTLEGYVVLWDEQADIGGQFVESFKRGAFTKSLADKQRREPLILVDHSAENVLGRVGVNATLTEDSRGLKATVTLPDTAIARDVKELASKGLLGGWSIGFAIPKGGDAFDGDTRVIHEAIAVEASVIRSHAAYEGTKQTVTLRSLKSDAERDVRRAYYLAVLGA